MRNDQNKTPEQLINEFFERVWKPLHDLDAIDELMTEDYEITTAGNLIKGKDRFKDWVGSFQKILLNATNESHDVFSDKNGERVVSRWTCTGVNNGIFGLAPDQKQVSFSGIAIWTLRDGRFSACWVERSALELYQSLLINT